MGRTLIEEYRIARKRWHKGLPRVFGCGCTLRSGAYTTALMSLVYAFLLAGAPYTMGVCGYRLCRKLDGGLAASILTWIAAALLTLASILMIIGAKTGQRELLLPWIGFSVVYVALWLIAAIVGLIFIAVQGAYVLAATAFFISLNMAVLPVYFVMTVAALYVRIETDEIEAAERALSGATAADGNAAQGTVNPAADGATAGENGPDDGGTL